jgi:uncharacterized coiled-coil protein SlyX
MRKKNVRTSELAEAMVVQLHMNEPQLAIEWAMDGLSFSLSRWEGIRMEERIAYEDQVAFQISTLEELASNLWHLHRNIVHARGEPRAHQKRLLKEGNEGYSGNKRRA